MPLLTLTDYEVKIIDQSLSHLSSLYSTGATRQISFSSRHINFTDRKKQEERIEEIRQGYRGKYNEVHFLQLKVHEQTT